jgi:cellulose 1,4-beta-cellobiosidase
MTWTAAALACAWAFAGCSGSDGKDGRDGAVGPAGEAGPPGATGPAGPAGPSGAPGTPGATGAPGGLGAIGPKGDPGAPGTPGTEGPQGQQGYGAHVANPYEGARGYVNRVWSNAVFSAAMNVGKGETVDAGAPADANASPSDAGESEGEKTLSEKMLAISQSPTAVWLSNIASIEGENGAAGLRDHLDAALLQAQNVYKPVVVTIVLYNLPARDCASSASNGELSLERDGLNRYRGEYISPIATILRDPKYASLRIAVLLEPDAIPNLVTNVGLKGTAAKELCDQAAKAKVYEEGIRYAVDELHPIPNVYIYADISQSGWLGYKLGDAPAALAKIYFDIFTNTESGVHSIDGIVSNMSNYVPTRETFLPDPNLYIGVDGAWDGKTGGPVRSVDFYQWNRFIDEESFVLAFRDALVKGGFSSDLKVIIDTSRNGWGGATRPTEQAFALPELDLSSISPVGYVNANKIDRRSARSNWCNQAGAGLGERPRAWPNANVAAYIWAKPPGESDGTYNPGAVKNPLLLDPMCDPSNGALPNAPAAGQWFQSLFEQLVTNAYPSI